MVCRVGIWLFGAASAAAVIVCPATARADEAYLCGPDKVVYVSVADLPMMKRTDPCIAAYYGLTVEGTSTAAGAQPAAGHAPAIAQSANSIKSELKPLSDNDIRGSAAEFPQQQAALAPARMPPRATVGTDYRNVKVLNAATPGSAWFHHAK